MLEHVPSRRNEATHSQKAPDEDALGKSRFGNTTGIRKPRQDGRHVDQCRVVRNDHDRTAMRAWNVTHDTGVNKIEGAHILMEKPEAGRQEALALSHACIVISYEEAYEG